MATDIYWLDALGGRAVAILARPRPGDWLQDEVAFWRDAGISTVVSMLETYEADSLGLAPEGVVVERAGLQFVSFPIADVGLPTSFTDVHRLTEHLSSALSDGRSVGVHCRAGIGRSSMIAACLLIEHGLTATDAFALISKARGLEVPDTLQQRSWAEDYERWRRQQPATLMA